MPYIHCIDHQLLGAFYSVALPPIRTNSCLTAVRLCTDSNNYPRSLSLIFRSQGQRGWAEAPEPLDPFFTSVLLGLPVKPAERSPTHFYPLLLVPLFHIPLSSSSFIMKTRHLTFFPRLTIPTTNHLTFLPSSLENHSSLCRMDFLPNKPPLDIFPLILALGGG
jgi:hypothetical protein